MAQYAYRPKDNRTPVLHPIFGGLGYGTVVESDTSPGPDFEPVKGKTAKPAAPASTAPTVTPAAKRPDAGKPAGANK